MAADSRTFRNAPAAGAASSSELDCRAGVSVCCHATGSRTRAVARRAGDPPWWGGSCLGQDASV
eukprot:5179914-Pyramimonas_sp.AAC.1